MNRRDFITYGVIFFAILLILMGVNRYYLRSALAPKVPVVEIIPPEMAPPPPIDEKAEAATMEKIRAAMVKKGEGIAFEPRRVERNPFLWPEEMESLTGPKPPKEPAKKLVADLKKREDVEKRKRLQLRMVIIGEKRKIALLNDALVQEGSQFGGSTVYKIHEQEISLINEEGERFSVPLSGPTLASKRERVSESKETSMSSGQEEALKSLFEKLTPLMKPGESSKK
jgi:hypothetical protein